MCYKNIVMASYSVCVLCYYRTKESTAYYECEVGGCDNDKGGVDK